MRSFCSVEPIYDAMKVVDQARRHMHLRGTSAGTRYLNRRGQLRAYAADNRIVNIPLSHAVSHPEVFN
jgi:hypothetical protein